MPVGPIDGDVMSAEVSCVAPWAVGCSSAVLGTPVLLRSEPSGPHISFPVGSHRRASFVFGKRTSQFVLKCIKHRREHDRG